MNALLRHCLKTVISGLLLVAFVQVGILVKSKLLKKLTHYSTDFRGDVLLHSWQADKTDQNQMFTGSVKVSRDHMRVRLSAFERDLE